MVFLLHVTYNTDPSPDLCSRPKVCTKKQLKRLIVGLNEQKFSVTIKTPNSAIYSVIPSDKLLKRNHSVAQNHNGNCNIDEVFAAVSNSN